MSPSRDESRRPMDGLAESRRLREQPRTCAAALGGLTFDL